MTHKIIWGPQHEARLVDLVKEADHVWNNKNTDFFNARLRNSSFQDIAAKLGGDFTSEYNISLIHNYYYSDSDQKLNRITLANDSFLRFYF